MPTFPILVASNDPSDSSALTGPFEHNGNLYVISNTYAGSTINIFKSTDSGLTWAGIQLGLGPFDGHIPGNYWDIALDGSDIVAVWYDGSGSKVRRFSMASDTWGTASAAGPDTSAGLPSFATNDPIARVVKTASGDLYYFYTEWLTTFQSINYAKFSSGAWGSGTIIVPASGTVFNYISAAFQDSNGLFHIFYRKAATQFATAALYHTTMSTGGVAGAENLIDATLRSVPTGRSFELGGKPYVIHYDSNSRTGVWEGSSLGATPTWSFTLLNTISFPAEVIDIGPQKVEAGSPSYGAKGFGFVDNGTAYVIWQSSNGQAHSYTVDRIYMASNSGSGWSAPTVLFDNAIDPGTYGPDKIFGISAAVISNQLYVFAAIDCGGLEYVSTLSVVTPGTPPTLICNSPPGGFVGTPYSHQLGLSGGTPPYTVTITVGALPTGLTISDTGLITGTPTVAGAFSFTVHVVDSTTAVANVTCSIPIISLPGSNCPDADQGGPG